MEGVTTAIVLFVFVCILFPRLIDNRPQYYVAFVCLLGIIVLDAVARLLGGSADARAVLYLGIALLQVVAIVLLFLAAGGLTVRGLTKEMAGAFEVVRRGEKTRGGDHPHRRAEVGRGAPACRRHRGRAAGAREPGRGGRRPSLPRPQARRPAAGQGSGQHFRRRRRGGRPDPDGIGAAAQAGYRVGPQPRRKPTTWPNPQTTLIILKPDAVERKLVGEILGRFEKKGLTLAQMKLTTISRELAETHYGEHKGKPFYESLVGFITGGPVVVMALSGPEAIRVARTLMGATKFTDALPGTIRGDFAHDLTANLVHGSDSPESAAREVELFFGA